MTTDFRDSDYWQVWRKVVQKWEDMLMRDILAELKSDHGTTGFDNQPTNGGNQ